MTDQVGHGDERSAVWRLHQKSLADGHGHVFGLGLGQYLFAHHMLLRERGSQGVGNG
ncbi:hypothetical protein [Streptomyces tateyamensis]|uniref:hypothetical protein n=1 Tax=Streptomyces tateyamensis TaxID=565073 RepID=UPI0015E8C973|nr:hypothetical protein [Streptomyces tateyamensis]